MDPTPEMGRGVEVLGEVVCELRKWEGSSGNSGNSGLAGMSERGGEEGANTAGRWLNSRWRLDGGGGGGGGFGRCRIRTEFTVANAELKLAGDARR